MSIHFDSICEIGNCQVCGTSNVPVIWPGDADRRVPQRICLDSKACETRCEPFNDNSAFCANCGTALGFSVTGWLCPDCIGAIR